MQYIKNKIVAFIVVIIMTNFSLPTGLAQDKLQSLPSLDKVWTPFEYKTVLDTLKSIGFWESLGEEHSSILLNKLVSYENLDVYLDKSLEPSVRIQIVLPYYEILPELQNFFEEKGEYGKAVLLLCFMLEATKRTTYLLDEQFTGQNQKNVNKEKKKLNGSIMKVLGSSFEVLKDSTIDDKYLILLASWLNENFLEFSDWINKSGAQECEEKIQSLKKSHTNKEVRKQMEVLQKKL